jgi:O-acetyl-ADP-ribose deacetylase (regulator of RNase III)
MANRASVFICYKRLLEREEAGQRIVQKNTEAAILRYLLAQDGGYDAWVDTAELMAGMEWEMEIYRRLLASDVLLALIGPGTAESEWVRREIALANALSISIVPVGFDLTEAEIQKEMKELGIDELQWTLTRNIDLDRGPALLEELGASLDRAATRTREAQGTMLDDLWRRRAPAKPKALDNQNAASFDLVVEPHHVKLHIASGDLAKLRNIDVMVSSENDYMQMARFFESRTVSAILRRRGAQISGGRYMDTIQQELDWQLGDRARPVQAAEVFPTSAGGPASQLARENKARAILHVAAVQAVAAENRVVPYKQPQQIEDCVRAAFSKMADLNLVHGVFSPPGSPARAEQEERAAAGNGTLRTIAFPLFGTGEGGLSASEVVGPMLDGMSGFLADPDNQALADVLSDVYICAFAQPDLDALTKALAARLVPDS